jgi:ParB/RepB/Spo0J family partition protein
VTPQPLFPADFRQVAIDLIDEPDIAMRQQLDDAKLEELIESIRAHGLLQPIGIVTRGERFVIAWGHRRYIAHRGLGADTILARIFPEGTNPELAKVHENEVREDVNPADQAVYYKQILEQHCGNDTVKLAAMVGRKLSFVEQRLNLVLGYPEVFEALRSGQITMAVAQELNKYADRGWMLTHLDAVLRGGANASQVRQWRAELERNPLLLGEPDPNAPAPAGFQAAPAPTMECAVCGQSHDPYNLEFMYIHRGGPCRNLLDRALNRLGGS